MFAMVFARIHLEVLFANATLAIQAMLPSQMDAQVFFLKKGGKSSAIFLLDEVDPMGEATLSLPGANAPR